MLNDIKLEEGLNDTIISLVPKVRAPEKVDDFRPISLCNVSSKIITKILVNQLKVVLPEVISQIQGAFLPGRLITDNFILAHEIGHFIRSPSSKNNGYLSLKTDMSKAYDRVEWDFLEAVMLRMGFPVQWVQLTMLCVTSIRYKLKLNESLSNIFLPRRGLRQGDPLSPYLFLICAQWLSNNISGAAHSRMLEGVVVGRGAPEITHLFFADDSLFYIKAKYQNVIALKEILEKYQYLSGQRINVMKSEVVYNSHVSDEARILFTNALGVSMVNSHNKYLGLPMFHGRRKCDLFQFLAERIMSKISGWDTNFLSSAGKEVLIKSVLQSIPQFVMMVFRIPKAICKRLTNAIVNFWWSQNRRKSIHWTDKHLLRRPKESGGLNFRDFELMNKAFLMKQFYRLLENPHSLIFQCLKARYFRNTSLLNSNLHYSSSSVWRGIWTAGVKAKRWIVVDQNNMISWSASSNGFFTVKSAYKCLKECRDEIILATKGTTSDSSQSTLFWKTVWKSQVQQKVKIFLWRLFHDALPVGVNLRSKGCADHVKCWFCNGIDESSTHLFLECWWSLAFWSNLGYTYLIPTTFMGNIADWLWYWVPKLSSSDLFVVLYALRTVWFYRNEKAHGKDIPDVMAVVSNTRSRINYYLNPNFKFYVVHDLGNLFWEPPAAPYIKLNCDGSWDINSTRMGFACVAKDCSGNILGVKAGYTNQARSSFEAEAFALFFATQWANEKGWISCIFETDCADLFKAIMTGAGNYEPSSIHVRECAAALSVNTRWRLTLIRREANSTADMMARRSRVEGWICSMDSSVTILP